MKTLPLILLSVLPLLASSCRAQEPTMRTVSSIAELREAAALPGAQITLKPGEYWLDSGGNKNFLDLSGAGSRFNFAGTHLRVDSRQLKGFGRGHENVVNIVQVSGKNIEVDGLKLSIETVDGQEGWADMYSNALQITADGATIQHADITTGGSRPYGSGDAFGKGGRPANGNQPDGTPFFDHHKQSGLRVNSGAGNVTLDDVRVHMRSFGHGIYFQDGAHDISIKNCLVEGGEMANSDDIIADPLYQKYGRATYGEKLPADIRISKSEDGIRVYGKSEDYPAVKNVRIENTRVFRMRDAYAMGDMEGKLEIVNSQAWECEHGFTPGGSGVSTIAGCRGDALYGPLLFFRRGGNGVKAEVELASEGDKKPQGVWPIALISGTNHQVTLTRSAPTGLYPATAYVLVSQAWREWRHRPETNVDKAPATSGLSLINRTGQPVVLGVAAKNNVVTSDAIVIDKGTGNKVTAPVWQPHPLRASDTWGEYQIYPAL